MTKSSISARQSRLSRELATRRLDALVVACPPNIFYLTGFQGSAGVAVFGLESCNLWVDPRYTLAARDSAVGVEVIEKRSDLLASAGKRLLGDRKGRAGRSLRVGYDEAAMTCAEFARLRKAAPSGIEWVSAGGLVEDLRIVKDAGEIALIREAARITVESLREVLPLINPGVRENDLAAEIEYRMKRKGAEGPAFETIVASGPRSAWPHARPTSKCLQQGELVIFDLGAILGGYAADMTRTFFLGKPPLKIRRLFNAVKEAQAEGLRASVAGKTSGQVDAAVRRSLAGRRLDSYFTHSTGHGVGVEIHERPRLARKGKIRLAAGCVVTIEPGVYIEGLGGVRIEDTVLVSGAAPEILTPASKDNWIIG